MLDCKERQLEVGQVAGHSRDRLGNRQEEEHSSRHQVGMLLVLRLDPGEDLLAEHTAAVDRSVGNI